MRMSRSRAPIERRMPISRVRSATLTSMMFITPMPPTTRLTAATERRSAESTSAIACCACAELGLRVDDEVGVLARRRCGGAAAGST